MRARLAACLLISLGGCASPDPVAFQWQSAQYLAAPKPARTLAVLKPAVEFREIKQGTTTRDERREAPIAQELSSLVAARLRERGLTVQAGVAGGAELHAPFEQESNPLYLDKDAPPPALAPIARPLAQSAGADMVLLVRYAVTDDLERSDAAFGAGLAAGMAMGLATGVAIVPGRAAPRNQTSLEFALIDGASGELIWSRKTYFFTTRLGYDIVDTALAGFPAAPAAR